MSDKLYILIDIGGTAIKSGVSTDKGEFLTRDERPTQAKEVGGPGIVEKVHKIISSYLEAYSKISGVAISTAGMVNPEISQIIYALPDAIPDYTGVNFKTIVEETYKLPCFVENDVNCAALGEMFKGSGMGLSSLFCMTIGTSIGGAMILDKKLVSGASNSAGEVAYMRIPGGILHSLASTTYLVKTYAALINVDPKEVNGKIIFDRAESGEKNAQDAILDLVEHLTDGMVNVISVQNPEAIILGGGIMARESYLRPLIEAKLKEKLRPIVFEATQVKFASLKNDAGMLGALYNFLSRI